MPHWTYRLRYIRCGKPNCRCATGDGHGPYWYGYRHQNGRMYTHYFGRRPSSTFDPPPPEARAEARASENRWTFTGKMNLTTALRIFAIPRIPSQDELTARWRRLIWEHHPDHGGDVRIAAAINAAYHYLKR